MGEVGFLLCIWLLILDEHDAWRPGTLQRHVDDDGTVNHKCPYCGKFYPKGTHESRQCPAFQARRYNDELKAKAAGITLPHEQQSQVYASGASRPLLDKDWTTIK